MSNWEYFSYESDRALSCGCCGTRGMDDDFMLLLDRIRRTYGGPMVVTSGYRCPEYNTKVSSTGATGPHTTGRAVDIHVVGDEALRLIGAAIAEGATGIGVAQKGSWSGRFIHIDNLDENRPWAWSY